MGNQLSDVEIIKRYKKSMESHLRHNVKNKLLLIKAKEKGITVSEKEIDDFLKLKPGK